MTRTPLFLIANLGSEVSKIIKAKEKKDFVVFDLAKKKAASIISDLKNLPETKENKEIKILSEVVIDLMNENSKYQISPQNLKSYFLPFSMRLMGI